MNLFYLEIIPELGFELFNFFFSLFVFIAIATTPIFLMISLVQRS